ncbi:hypothetical protein LTR62_008180 [Meristemomyces frigidus]|uniref:Myb-like domain-containing protein n=1 Tax=Meristemomyces frigidus TaxID=1508187 RepID=A0AAN7TB72_9PEZI|nr:hypothetical protein LTR62_008180 [Meristemomyces frigidus]
MTRNSLFGIGPFKLIRVDADDEKSVDSKIGRKTSVTYYDVKKDKDVKSDEKKDHGGKGKKGGKGSDGDQKQNGDKGSKNKQHNNDNKDEKKNQKGGEGTKKGPQNRGWTAEDDAKLLELWKADTTLKAIAKELKRSQPQCKERYEQIAADSKKNSDEKKKTDSEQKLSKKQKKAAKKADAEEAEAKEAKVAAVVVDVHASKKKKVVAAKAPSTPGIGESRFTMNEWLTLQEDSLFSFGELQCLSEIIMKDQKQTWLRIAARFFDLTGRRVHPNDIREKFEAMAA